ncbi:MAG: sulfotransferase domain-containing protein [Pseudomonadota bacterium]
MAQAVSPKQRSKARELRRLMIDAGMGSHAAISGWLRTGVVQLNGHLANTDSEVAPGDQLRIHGSHEYEVTRVPKTHRWTVTPRSPIPNKTIAGLRRVHCGQHKCLTMFSRAVLERVCTHQYGPLRGFRHFFGRLDEFYRYAEGYPVSSVSGHRIDLDRFEDVRVTRFVRDPRDLVVSGYFYHRRKAEGWCGYVNPTQEEWERVNGALPSALPAGESLTSFLEQAPLEEGLRAEIDFRLHHFESLLAWPEADPRVLTLRYEDIVGNESNAFGQVLRHFEMPLSTRLLGRWQAFQSRASKSKRHNRHIRDPHAGQWRQHFTPQLAREFNARYADLLKLYGYPLA